MSIIHSSSVRNIFNLNISSRELESFEQKDNLSARELHRLEKTFTSTSNTAKKVFIDALLAKHRPSSCYSPVPGHVGQNVVYAQVGHHSPSSPNIRSELGTVLYSEVKTSSSSVSDSVVYSEIGHHSPSSPHVRSDLDTVLYSDLRIRPQDVQEPGIYENLNSLTTQAVRISGKPSLYSTQASYWESSKNDGTFGVFIPGTLNEQGKITRVASEERAIAKLERHGFSIK
ncbi:MAG: hypothetical protein ACRCRU_01485 [Vibrio sp.]|uniref:hypothetical protein n=1 Tax=Vibrio sp. TaxID=678 RepID=UPI003F3C481E